MKQFKTTILLITLMSIISIKSNAYDFEVDGICYNVVSIEDLTCEVTRKYYNYYKGNINVPNEVLYNGKKLTVVKIGKEAFYDGNVNQVTSVKLPNTIIEIGIDAFRYTKISKIDIPSSVKTIRKGAFRDCSNLISFKMGAGIELIGSRAFANCTNLSSVTFTNNINEISEGLFSGCTSLTKLKDVNSIKKISKNAFYGCKAMQPILPPKIEEIGDSAFYECKSIDRLIIPSSCMVIGNHAFSQTPRHIIYEDNSVALKIGIGSSASIIPFTSYGLFSWADTIYLGRSIEYIGETNGWPYDKTISPISVTISDILRDWNIGNVDFSRSKHITFGKRITYIKDFSSYNNLESLVVRNETPPNAIGFSNKTYLNCKLYVPKGCKATYKSTEVWKNFFNIIESDSVPVSGISLNCTTLAFNAVNQTANLTATITPSNATNKNVTWTSSNTDVATVSDAGVVTSKANGTTIVTARTTDGTNLTATCEVTVVIPSVLATGISLNQTTLSFNEVNQTATLIATVIPSNATNKNVTWSSSNTDVAIVSDAGVVTSKANGTAVITAKTTDGTNLTATCSVIVNSSPNIIFADANVKKICVAYWDTNGDGELSKEEVAAVTDLGIVFRGNKSITSFNELQYFTGLTSIGNHAFEGCSGLTSVTIPNSVTSIGDWAFSNCSSLTFVTIPNCVTSIGRYAFEYCSGLTSVVIGSGVTSIGNLAFMGCSGLTSITIPNSVTNIGEWAFSDCRSLTSVTIGNGITSIGDCAFCGCSGLTSITIPDGVTNIGSHAFSGCSGLTSITIGNSVTSIGEYAFLECSSLTSITIPNSVTSIGRGAFIQCIALTSITIPESVTSIGYAAFYKCESMEKVIVPDIAAWCGISFSDNEANPLYYAHHIYSDESTEITNLIIPNNVTSIGYSAFYNCSGLTSITIPNRVTSIGDYAFESCSGLTSVMIGNSVTSIGDCAFCGCSGLASVTIPESVTNIGYKTFLGCSGLTSIIIPGSVTSIGDYAFYNCSGLTSVTIPNSVTNIGEDAFYGCSGLGKVIVPDIAAWCGISFGNDSANPLFCGHHLYSNEFTEITDLVIPNKVTSISNYAFCGCSGLTSITIPIVGVSAFTVGMKVKITGKLMKYVKNGEVTPEIMKADVVVLEQGEGGGGQGGDDSGGQGGGGDPVTDLTNGDFENWVSDSEPAGWKSASSASNATLSKNTDARGGNFSCMVAAPGTQNKRLATQEMTLEAGSYTFSYYAKSTTGDKCQTRGGYVPVKEDGSVGAYTYKKTYTDLNNSGWTLVSYDFELASKTTLCLVVMNPKGSNYSVSQDILVDDATLTKNNIRKAAATGSSPDDDVIPITCAEAVELTNMLADGETSTETYSITGYITEVIGNVSRNQQSFWMADTKDGGKVLEAYWANLPEGVTNIGYKAFSSCKGLKEIYCFAEETPQVDSETFYDIQPREILLVVPDVAVEQYKAHPIWSKFWIETPTGVRLDPALSHWNDIRYDIQGRKLNALQKGINIIRYSDGTTRKVLIK